MEKEPISLKKVIINGVVNGLIFTLFMEGYYNFFTDEQFSFLRVFIHFFAFGFFMALTFRHQYKKKK
ncbi:MAG: hypothetical protein CMC05_03885 [Flavobacteriaceae bacterium]|jgi:hypothetical protein|uniref:hypothetical protein n=1 Tax=Winogradskyella poriferorum TaxID=307627 RepID=UPI000C8CA859|nr:hypothetical protein [Flavobacteriaceae bacterium]|tara:strand:+ start:1455 stop:1655 length:201 start_codon:yes stop_codon:yes gene_type:complete